MTRGEVYLCPVGRRDATGRERLIPVVVLTRDAINRYGPVVSVAPIVERSAEERPDPSHVLLRAPEGGLTVDSLILTLQLRPVLREWLRHRLGQLSVGKLGELDCALRLTLDLDDD